MGNWSSLIGKLRCHNGDSDSPYFCNLLYLSFSPRYHRCWIFLEAYLYFHGHEGGDDDSDECDDAEGRQETEGNLQGVGLQPEGHQVVTHAEA